MSQVFVRIVARYAPIVTFPVAIVLGVIGYNIEKLFPRKATPTFKSFNEEREERLLKELTTNETNTSTEQTKNFLDRNQSADLRK
jgi:hypothetical protein